jgi:steroid delta-isomerase-like uncharacterized protein
MTDSNKTIVHLYTEAFNNRDLSIIDEIVADNFVDHHYPPDLPPGPEGVKQWYNMLFTAFPDGRALIEDVIAEENKVVIRYQLLGTHEGDFMGIPATGKQFSMTSINIVRIVDGQLVESWETDDRLGLLQQLGLLDEKLK